MFNGRLSWGIGFVCSLVVGACSGDDGSGLLSNADAGSDAGGSGGAGSGAGGRSSGGGGVGGGAGTAGGAGAAGTSGASGAAGSSGGGGIGGADASGAAGAGGDAGAVDASNDGSGGSASDARADAAEAAVPGCPQNGRYSLTSSGAGCGDLSNAAPNQRMDASPAQCTGYFEFDGGGAMGVSSGTLTFERDGGALAASQVHVGSAIMSCTGSGTQSTVSLQCSGDAGSCSIELVWTGT